MRHEALFLSSLRISFTVAVVVTSYCTGSSKTLPLSLNRAASQKCRPVVVAAVSSMPRRPLARALTGDVFGELRSELQDLSPHRFVGDIQTALRE